MTKKYPPCPIKKGDSYYTANVEFGEVRIREHVVSAAGETHVTVGDCRIQRGRFDSGLHNFKRTPKDAVVWASAQAWVNVVRLRECLADAENKYEFLQNFVEQH